MYDYISLFPLSPPKVVDFCATVGICGIATDHELSADGFFDAGKLLQALRTGQEQSERPSEKAAARREVGKKLRLMEY